MARNATLRIILNVAVQSCAVVAIVFITIRIANVWAMDEAQRSQYLFIPSVIKSNHGEYPLIVAAMFGVPGFVLSLTRHQRIAKALGISSLLGGLLYIVWSSVHLFMPSQPPFQMFPARPVLDNVLLFLIAYWGPPVFLGFLTLVFSFTSLKRIQRFPKGQCALCGYNLTGNMSGICPECGNSTASQDN